METATLSWSPFLLVQHHHYIYVTLYYSGAKQGDSSKTVVIPEVVTRILYWRRKQSRYL
jgi:hypothetical protein